MGAGNEPFSKSSLPCPAADQAGYCAVLRLAHSDTIRGQDINDPFESRYFFLFLFSFHKWLPDLFVSSLPFGRGDCGGGVDEFLSYGRRASSLDTVYSFAMYLYTTETLRPAD